MAQRLDPQVAEHKAEADDSDAALQATEEHAATVQAEVTGSLTVPAEADGREYLEAAADEADAMARRRTAGRLGRRCASRDHQAAHERTETARDRLQNEWGSLPASDDALTA